MPVTEQNEQSKGQPREVWTITVFQPPARHSAVPSATEKSGVGRVSRSVSRGAMGLCWAAPAALRQERLGTAAYSRSVPWA